MNKSDIDEEIENPQAKLHDDLFGVLSDEDCNNISEALLETQRIDIDEW